MNFNYLYTRKLADDGNLGSDVVSRILIDMNQTKKKKNGVDVLKGAMKTEPFRFWARVKMICSSTPSAVLWGKALRNVCAACFLFFLKVSKG